MNSTEVLAALSTDAIGNLAVQVVFAIIASVWVLRNHWYRTSAEQVRLTMQLYAEYSTAEMIAHRVTVWNYVTHRRQQGGRFPWSSVWARYTEADDIVSEEVVNAFVQVTSIWSRLYAFDRENLIDQSLAKDLFAYQYDYWSKHFSDLVVDTNEIDRDAPDVLVAFQPNSLLWLRDERGGFMLLEYAYLFWNWAERPRKVRRKDPLDSP